jgi:hypothetical protein
MEADASAFAMNAIQKFDKLQGFYGQAGLFPHLADDGGLKRFAQLDQAARQRPTAFHRFASPPH